MSDVKGDEITLIPPDIISPPFTTNDADIKIADSNMPKLMHSAIIKASNVFIKCFNGDCNSIAQELKGSIQTAFGGLWICAVSKGIMGATTSVNKGREAFFKIGDYRFFISQISVGHK